MTMVAFSPASRPETAGRYRNRASRADGRRRIECHGQGARLGIERNPLRAHGPARHALGGAIHRPVGDCGRVSARTPGRIDLEARGAAGRADLDRLRRKHPVAHDSDQRLARHARHDLDFQLVAGAVGGAIQREVQDFGRVRCLGFVPARVERSGSSQGLAPSRTRHPAGSCQLPRAP